MFRTNSKCGRRRVHMLRRYRGDKRARIVLTPDQMRMIESSNAITLVEKLELLLVAVGNKLTTELYMKIQYKMHARRQQELPIGHDIATVEGLLRCLPFSFFRGSRLRADPATGHPQRLVWVQVSVNAAVSAVLKSFPDDLSEIEEGVLYGYPVSAIRAFAGLIEASHEKPTAAMYYLAGVNSRAHAVDEREYFEKLWKRLGALSPKLIRQAEEGFGAVGCGLSAQPSSIASGVTAPKKQL